MHNICLALPNCTKSHCFSNKNFSGAPARLCCDTNKFHWPWKTPTHFIQPSIAVTLDHPVVDKCSPGCHYLVAGCTTQVDSTQKARTMTWAPGFHTIYQCCYSFDNLIFGQYRSIFHKIPLYRYRFLLSLLIAKKRINTRSRSSGNGKIRKKHKQKTSIGILLEVAKLLAQKRSNVHNGRILKVSKKHLFKTVSNI